MITDKQHATVRIRSHLVVHGGQPVANSPVALLHLTSWDLLEVVRVARLIVFEYHY